MRCASVTGVQTCALPISWRGSLAAAALAGDGGARKAEARSTHQTAWPADAHQRLVGVRQRELIHAPRLVRWDLLAFEDRIAHPLGNLGDAVGVEIEAERILPRHPPADRKSTRLNSSH